jgi:hypothetical protein
MLFNNIGEVNLIQKNPTIKSLYIQQFEDGGFPIPPSSSFIVTDPNGDDFIITESGSRMITE